MQRFLSYEGPPVRGLKQLRKLRLLLEVFNTVSREHLFEVLRYSTQLTEALLGQCPLTDVLLSSLVASGSFLKLHVLDLQDIQSVTVTSLRELVCTPSDLAFLSIYRCPSLSRADIESLRTLADDLGVNLQISYSEP